MGINSDHIIGFLLGIGASALGYQYYKKNKTAIDSIIDDIRKPRQPVEDEAVSDLSLEELLLMKERLEDLIAEHESGNAPAEESAEPAEEEPAKKGKTSGTKKGK